MPIKIKSFLQKALKQDNNLLKRREARGSPVELHTSVSLATEPEEWRVTGRYNVGPVKYLVYKDDYGVPRLHIREPPHPGVERLKELVTGHDIPRNMIEKYHLDKARSGYGSIYPLIIDPHIEEIAVDGPHRPVAVIHKYYPGRWMNTDIVLDEEEADSLSLQLARKAGRIVSIASPYAEGLTGEGHRVAVTFRREISRFGSTAVIRKYPSRPITIADLIAAKVISPLAAAYLWILIEAQAFIVIIGNMGSGKTTLLQALAGLIPPYYRIVTIEDTPELRLPHDHWDSLIVRSKTPGGEAPEISLEDLLRFSLRRRAEYIIVGEVRGRETRLLAQAAASGHGSLTTFHADSPEGAILRMRLDPINLPPLFLQVITAFVLVRRIPVVGGKVKRRMYSITEVNGDELVEIFEWRANTDTHAPQRPWEVLEASKKLAWAWEKLGVPHEDLEAELDDRAKFLERTKGMEPSAFHNELLNYYSSRGW
ncbi:MAG: type II/IV secretion system ATPase subunit [Desulfurococcales archaeon]|nr:type II/IV secretion system ATPase subunit [Desulfurococcales archaeon]